MSLITSHSNLFGSEDDKDNHEMGELCQMKFVSSGVWTHCRKWKNSWHSGERFRSRGVNAWIKWVGKLSPLSNQAETHLGLRSEMDGSLKRNHGIS